ncbi:MAG TPA: amidohydrolase family protein [Planctomycetota bacterium]|nr:amidohydrolase family protein [Planctomycetota bacterium]
MWRETTKRERNMSIFREEFAGWLPKRILDFHVHVFNPATLPQGATYNCAGHALRRYGFAELRRDLAELYPGRRTAAVCFGLPDRIYNRAANDRYVAAGCDNRRFFAFRLLDPSEDPAVVRRDLASGPYLGVKPYLNYVRKPVDDVEIDDMLPAPLMKVINELGLIVMLHIPRKGRLADPVNQEQLVALCRRWPNAKIVLAHVGRAYFLKNVVGHIDRLRKLPNLWYDLAMVGNPEVLEHVFATVPADRVLYATDQPIAVAPGKSLEINNQYSYITPAPWKLAIHDTSGRVVYTCFAYEELRGIGKAVARLGLGRRFLNGLFHDNGMRLLQAAMRSKER